MGALTSTNFRFDTLQPKLSFNAEKITTTISKRFLHMATKSNPGILECFHLFGSRYQRIRLVFIMVVKVYAGYLLFGSLSFISPAKICQVMAYATLKQRSYGLCNIETKTSQG